jgi:hypothetical protein
MPFPNIRPVIVFCPCLFGDHSFCHCPLLPWSPPLVPSSKYSLTSIYNILCSCQHSVFPIVWFWLQSIFIELFHVILSKPLSLLPNGQIIGTYLQIKKFIDNSPYICEKGEKPKNQNFIKNWKSVSDKKLRNLATVIYSKNEYPVKISFHALLFLFILF